MILFRHIVQIGIGLTLATVAQLAACLQVRDSRRAGRVPIEVNESWQDLQRPPERHPHEVLSGNNILFGRYHEVSGLAPGVDGPISG